MALIGSPTLRAPLRGLGTALGAVGLAGVLGLLGAVSLAWNLCAWPLYRLLPEARGRALGRAVISGVYRRIWQLGGALGLLRFDGRCLDALAHEPRLIVVANHPTLLDALLIVSRLPASACIMKAELMGNPFLGAGARLARYIRNDSPRGLVRQAVADLKAGGQLVVFPEGTRTAPATALNDFRPGFTLIAKLAAAPIQCLIIEADSPYARKGWPLWRLPPLPIDIRLSLGERFAPEADSDALLARIEAYYRDLPRR